MSGRILIADDLVTSRLVLRVKLASARYEVLQADTADEAYEMARRASPDLILIDDRLDGGRGLDLCRRLKRETATQDLPVIVLSPGGDGARRLAALHAGADESLSKPIDDVALLARVRSLLRARETWQELRRRRTTAAAFGFAEDAAPFRRPGRVALVCEDAEAGGRWRGGLAPLLPDRVDLMTPDEALDNASAPAPADLFVIPDGVSCHGGGLGLLSNLRSRAGTRHSAIVFVHDRADPSAGATALDMGANDLLETGADPGELAIRARTQLRRKRESDRLRASVEQGLKLAATDPLTGLYNRRYAMAYLDRVGREAATAKKPFTVMLADLDWFKRINDTHGHAAGDAVLAGVAARLRDNLRGEDLVARIGGEEFLIALPDTPLDRAAPAAGRLCRLIGGRPIRVPGSGAEIAVTMSIGVAVGGTPGESVEGLIDRADRALYRAKADGRNKVDVSRSAA